MEKIRQIREYRKGLPFQIRCIMARYGSITIDELYGIGYAEERATFRRILNGLVKLGYATKEKDGKGSIYSSVREYEPESVRKFADSNETWYLTEDINKIIKGG